MRTTQVLLQQHAGWMFVRHWKIQGKRNLLADNCLKVLKQQNIPVVNALDVVNEKVQLPPYPIKSPAFFNSSNTTELVQHLTFNDSNVLVTGLDQAKVFTNSVEIAADSLNTSESDFSRHDLVKRCIRASLLYDAHQEKLPKITDPERPAWNFPRVFGLTDRRKNLLLCNRLIQLCSSLNPQLLAHRRTLTDAMFNVPLERDGEQVLLSLRADILLTSSEQLEPPSSYVDVDTHRRDKELPNISPLLPTLSLIKDFSPKDKLVDVSPFSLGFQKCNVHTAIVHLNSTEVANIHDLDINRDQILSRSLMKAYAFAIAEARRRYGNSDKLPHPVTVQCVQTDSKDFHFSVLQLNTVKSAEETDERNFYWSFPFMSLYDKCEYDAGKPILEGYNPSVFNTLLAFCCNS
ncbi:Ribosomal protein L37 [Nesidiocoris tenuis]|uniref:Large ribosomal subunit protein mL37 n=1 Tax=Nesidiocoris tenuis TaxID=355587 RepID=A0ABN7A6W0_9HEMI|nr:Ribosomal protein L37 [Nesidiocoris tenuis]